MANDEHQQVAGPSSDAVSKEELEAAEAMQLEGKALRFKDPDRAVQLLGQALTTKTKFYGIKSLHCADTYLYYGIALAELGRSTMKALGPELQRTTEQQEFNRDRKFGNEDPNKSKYQRTGTEAGKELQPADQQQAQQGGASTAEEGTDAVKSDDQSEESENEDEDEEAGEGGEDDLTLAWENVESARIIYMEDGAEKHLLELADAHITLGELSDEQEQFDAAAEEYGKALGYLEKIVPEDKRRIAEVHFKLALSYQFADQPETALGHCQRALVKLDMCRAQVERELNAAAEPQPAAAAGTAEGSAVEEAAAAAAAKTSGTATAAQPNRAAAIEKLVLELQNLNAVISDVQEMRAELQVAVQEHISMKQVLKSAYKMIGGLAGVSEAGPSGLQALQQAMRSSAGASSSTTAQLSAPTTSGPVQDLGVAGRGRSRITLQPVPAAVAAAAAAGKDAGDAGAAGTKPAAMPKRSLEDVMGGGRLGNSSSTSSIKTIGFGTSSAAPASASSSALLTTIEAKMAKRAKAEPASGADGHPS